MIFIAYNRFAIHLALVMFVLNSVAEEVTPTSLCFLSLLAGVDLKFSELPVSKVSAMSVSAMKQPVAAADAGCSKGLFHPCL